MTYYSTGVVPSLAPGSPSYSAEAQIVGSAVVFNKSGDVMRRCKAQLRRLKVIDGLLPPPQPMLKASQKAKLVNQVTRQPTSSAENAVAKSTESKSVAKDNA